VVRSVAGWFNPGFLSEFEVAKSKLLIALSLLLFFLAPSLSRAQSEQRIRKLLNQPENRKAIYAIHFCDPETSRTVFAHNKDMPLVPASNMKLITTSAAFDLLGPDFVFKTVFALQKNNLVILAGGDPLLGDPVYAAEKNRDLFFIFEQILEQLRKRNISVVSGDLVIDDFLFDDERFHPAWPIEQANRWYAAQVSALNFNDNCLDITMTATGPPGEPGRFSILPETAYVKIINQSKNIKTGANTTWAARPVNSNLITIKGAIRNQHTFNVTIERPSAFFGHVLAEYLLKNGIAINGKLIIKEIRNAQAQQDQQMDIFYVHQTPLKDVLTRANRDSLNLAAECIFKTIGAWKVRLDQSVQDDNQTPAQPQRGSWETGRAAVSGFLNKLNIDSGQFIIDDGSGLSHDNRLSPRCITSVLVQMFNHPNFDIFRGSLATPTGGTLKKNSRFSETTYRDRIYAKSGYVKSAWALSGFCRKTTGDWLAFSIITNKGSTSQTRTIDLIVKEMMK